jgi:hypothetical protein
VTRRRSGLRLLLCACTSPVLRQRHLNQLLVADEVVRGERLLPQAIERRIAGGDGHSGARGGRGVDCHHRRFGGR